MRPVLFKEEDISVNDSDDWLDSLTDLEEESLIIPETDPGIDDLTEVRSEQWLDSLSNYDF